jgi:2-dehydropantoate 2-reductase
MTIAVVGAGGVGGYFAALLSEAGEEVWLVARGAGLEAIRDKGLRLTRRGETLCIRPARLSDDPADFGGAADAVLFCTKGYDLEEAARRAAPMIGPETLLVPFGNGVGNAERLKRLYPENPVANGAVYIVAHQIAPGHIEMPGYGALAVLGGDGALPEGAEALAEALKRVGVKVVLSNRITTEVWKKFLLIAAMSTLTSCHDAPMGAIVEKHGDELDAMLDEIIAVGRAEGADIGEADKAKVLEQVGLVPYDSPNSMWLDLKAGRQTELAQLGGYVLEKAQKHGIDAPVTRRCVEKILSKLDEGSEYESR